MSIELSQNTAVVTKSFSRYRFVIAGLLLAAHFTLGINFFSISPLLPLVIEDYDITRATASLLIAVPTLAKAFFGLPASVIINRFGLKPVFSVSWFMIATLSLSALAPNFGSLLLLRLLYGIGAGLMMPAIGPLVMQWFRPKEMAIMNSAGLIVMSAGIAFSVAIAAPLSTAVSWQVVLTIFGLITLISAVAWSFLGRVKQKKQGSTSRFTFKDMWQVLSNRTIFLLVVSDALVFILYAAHTSWLPTFYNEFRGMSLVQAGNLTGLLPFVGMFAVLLGGYLALRVKSKRLFFIIPGILVGLGGFGAFMFEQTALIALSVMVLGIGTWIYQPMLLTLPMQLPWMTEEKISVVWGSSLTIAGLGMFISPIVVGASRDTLGTFVPGFFIWAMLAWALLIAGFLLPEQDVSGEA